MKVVIDRDEVRPKVRLYHGSNVEVKKPSLRMGRKRTDFGRGLASASTARMKASTTNGCKSTRRRIPMSQSPLRSRNRSLSLSSPWSLRKRKSCPGRHGRCHRISRELLILFLSTSNMTRTCPLSYTFIKIKLYLCINL